MSPVVSPAPPTHSRHLPTLPLGSAIPLVVSLEGLIQRVYIILQVMISGILLMSRNLDNLHSIQSRWTLTQRVPLLLKTGKLSIEFLNRFK